MNWKIILAFMVSFALLMSSSYTMLIPFLPLYLEKELHASYDSISMWSGACFAITFGISSFAAPLWGKLSDKIGKKSMIIRSSLLLSVTYFLAGTVHTPLQLFLVRAFQGIAAGLWPACLIMISAYVPKNRLGLSMGLMQSANITGGVLGPLFGGLLSMGFGMRHSFFIGSAVLSLICISTIFFIKEPPAVTSINGKPLEKTTSKTLLKDKNIIILMVGMLVANAVIMQIQPIMALYVQSLNKSTMDVVLLSGIILSFGGFAGAMSSPFWGRAGQKKGFYNAVTVACLGAGSLMIIQSLPDNLLLFGITQFLVGLCFSGIFPSFNSILVLITPPNARGISFGILSSAQMLGGAIGPIVGSIIVGLLSFSYVYIFAGSTLVLLGLYLLFLAPADFKDKANSTSVVKHVTADANAQKEV